MYELLRFLHILSASAWLGATLWVAGDVRRTLALGRPHPGPLPALSTRALGRSRAAGAATLVTGLAVMFYVGGHPRTGLMIGFALTLVRLAVVAAGLRPAWRRIATRLAAGEDVPASDGAVGRMVMFSGIAHTLWLLALATMVFPI